MRLYNSSRLIRILIYISISGFVVISATLIFIFTKNTIENYKTSLQEIKISHYKKAKLEAKDRIDKIVDFIGINKNLLYKAEKEKVKNSVLLGIEIIQNVYEQYQWFPKDIIYEKIRDKLRNIRFFDNHTGYFFMYDLEGNCLLLPTTPSLEGKNLLYIKDATGQHTIRKLLEIAKTKEEGFWTWHWYKPDEKVMKEKIGFVKIFKPLNIFIGTARYKEDIIINIEKELKKYLHSLDNSTYGYIFAYDYLGNMKKEGENYTDINRWDDTIKGYHLIKDAIIGAKLNPDGFYMTYTAKNEKERLSYIRAIPDLQWIIGTQVEKEKEFFMDQKRFLDKKLKKIISNTLWLAIVVLMVMIIGFLFVAQKIKTLFKILEKSLIKTNKKLAYRATHDTLTNLPNRLLLIDRLEHALNNAQREKHMVAVVFLDLDNFKIVNDAYGHEIGDTLLKYTAKIINSKIRKSDTVARFGGDEFVILLDNLHKVEDIMVILNKILNSFQKSFYIKRKKIVTTVSLGVAIYPNDTTKSETLLRYADMAMYKAKSEGKNRYVLYNKSMNEQVSQHLKIEEELKKALKNDEFILHYQPQIEVGTEKLVGFEALVRWQHPKKGLIYPNYFIEIAEDSNLIIEIGNTVLKKAMLQMKEWYKKGYNPGIMSVNFASKQLESKELFKIFENLLEETECRAKWIEVEVIERYLAKDINKSIKMLEYFRRLGLGIAIDDFGTGYSSLSYLKYLPVTKLKIDKSFIDGIETNYADKAIAKSIIDLAKGLRVKVLAEGVESKEQYAILKKMGCEIIQGYYFYKPLSKDDAQKLLSNMV